jgi:hypothetical protein
MKTKMAYFFGLANLNGIYGREIFELRIELCIEL